VDSRARFRLPLLLALVCLGCSAPGRHLRVVFGTGPYSLDPHYSNESVSYAIYSNIYEALVRFEPGKAAAPALAKRWANPDELTWEFELDESSRFHDGSPVTSADVVFSLERARDDPRSAWRFAVADVSRVEAPAPARVVIHTRRPLPTLLQNLADIAVVPKVYVTKGHDLDTQPLGSGPYRFVARDSRSGAVDLSRSPHRASQPAAIEHVTFSAIPDEGRRVAALLSGSADLVGDLPADAVPRIESAASLRVLRVPSLRELFLAFDTGRPRTPYASPPKNPFLDRRVRLAFLRAIDTPRICREIVRGAGEEATQLVSPAVFGFDPGYHKPVPDKDAARRLLQEAGFGGGFAVTLDTPHDTYPGDAAIADAVAESLRAVGVEVTVRRRDKQQHFQKLEAGDTSFYMLSWGATTADMQEIFDSLLRTRDTAHGFGSDNFGRFSDAELDHLAEEASVTSDPIRRLELLQHAGARAMDEAAWVPIYVQTELYGIRTPFRWAPQSDKRIRIVDVEG
jgi:peptide/nickel transport system substrate-binding protein